MNNDTTTMPAWKMAALLAAYTTYALWSSRDGNGIPLDQTGCIIAENTRKRFSADLQNFWNYCDKAIGKGWDNKEIRSERIAHYFWLCRNGEGSGFDDKNLGAFGRSLAEASERFGPCKLYIRGGLIHASCPT